MFELFGPSKVNEDFCFVDGLFFKRFCSISMAFIASENLELALLAKFKLKLVTYFRPIDSSSRIKGISIGELSSGKILGPRLEITGCFSPKLIILSFFFFAELLSSIPASLWCCELSSSSYWFQLTSRKDDTCSFVYPVFAAVNGIWMVSSLVNGPTELSIYWFLKPVVLIGAGVLTLFLLAEAEEEACST